MAEVKYWKKWKMGWKWGMFLPTEDEMFTQQDSNTHTWANWTLLVNILAYHAAGVGYYTARLFACMYFMAVKYLIWRSFVK